MDAREVVLTAARKGLRAETAEEGFAAMRRVTSTSFSDAELAGAVAAAVAERVLRDPIRLMPGALQCHWKLELTAEGHARARQSPPSSGPAGKEANAHHK